MTSFTSIVALAVLCMSMVTAQHPGVGKCPTPPVQEQFQLASVSSLGVNPLLHNTCTCTDWCSEIGSLTSLDACNSGASSDRKEPISLQQAVYIHVHSYALAKEQPQAERKDHSPSMKNQKKKTLPQLISVINDWMTWNTFIHSESKDTQAFWKWLRVSRWKLGDLYSRLVCSSHYNLLLLPAHLFTNKWFPREICLNWTGGIIIITSRTRVKSCSPDLSISNSEYGFSLLSPELLYAVSICMRKYFSVIIPVNHGCSFPANSFNTVLYYGIPIPAVLGSVVWDCKVRRDLWNWLSVQHRKLHHLA